MDKLSQKKMNNPTLILPTINLKDSFIEAVAEFQKEGLYVDLSIHDLKQNFEKYINSVLKQAQGINLPKRYVPMTRYWLVDDNQFIGRFDIRHELSKNLRKVGGHVGYDIRPSKRKMGYGSTGLKLTLQKAKDLGLEKVLITCDKTNVGSAKIIKKNGGILQDETEVEIGKPLKCRYWITIQT